MVAFEQWRPWRLGKFPVKLFAVLLVVVIRPAAAGAERVLVAVATNFWEAAECLADDFEKATQHDVTLTTSSTGKLYAQILSGAPFDVFLAADRRRPELLEQAGLTAPGSRMTYAIGRLTLWSSNPGRIDDDGRTTLRETKFRRLAMANPEFAPYGIAARQTLIALGLDDDLQDRIVTGENIGQAYALVATGNADLGFVALSYVLSARNKFDGSRWDVPESLHAPILQDAVLLQHGNNNAAASAFLAYLKTSEGRESIRSFGYAVE